MPLGDTDALLLLNMTPGLGPRLIARAVDTLGTADAVVGASVADLCRVEGIGKGKATRVREAVAELMSSGALAREKQLIAEHNVRLIIRRTDAYPRLLHHIPDPPVLLYVKGTHEQDMALAIAVVGARQCTAYGREQADRFAAACCGVGLTVVSGGAYGIDSAAHRAAIRVKGRTVAVLGSGLAKPYPPEHVDLFRDIVDAGGAVISEFPVNTPPLRENFSRRNRVISGMSLGTLVVEAGRRSGALITARQAAEEHGREVMAVPGRVDSRMSEGCHELLKSGCAAMVTSLEDILDALGETGQLLKAGATPDDGKAEQPALFDAILTDTQQRIVKALDEAKTVDQLAAASGLAMPVLMADLTLLQVRGVVEKQGATFGLKRGG